MGNKQQELPLLANREWGLRKLGQALEELGAKPRVDTAPVPCLTPGCVYSTQLNSADFTLGWEVTVTLPETARVNPGGDRLFELHCKAFEENINSLWMSHVTESGMDWARTLGVEMRWGEGSRYTLMYTDVGRGLWGDRRLQGVTSIRFRAIGSGQGLPLWEEERTGQYVPSLSWVEHQLHRAIEALLSRLFLFED